MTFLAPLRFLEAFAPVLPWSNGGLLSIWCWPPIAAIASGLGISLILNLISIVVRRKWLAAALLVLVLTLVLVSSYGRPFFATTARLAIWHMVLVYTLVRFGVFATVAQLYTIFAIQDFPLTTNWSAWYAQAVLLGIVTLLALALYEPYRKLTER